MKKVEVLKTRNYLRHSTPGISENALKKVNIFEDIKLENFIQLKLIFSIYKNWIFISGPILNK